MQSKFVFLLFSITFLFVNCKKEKHKTLANSNIAVEYESYQLGYDEINESMPKGLSKEDSVLWVNNYIEKWLKNKLLIEKAKKGGLSATQKESIKEKVEHYQDDLLLNEYTNQLIKNLEKDSVQFSEIKRYYEQNENNFILSKKLVQYQYINLGKGEERSAIPFMKNNTESIKKLVNLAEEKNYPLEMAVNEDWVAKEELLRNLDYEMKQKLAQTPCYKGQFLSLEKGSRIFLLKILGVRKKGEIAPLNYVKSSIKNRLINKRKLILLDKYKNQLYHNAKDNKEFKRFNP